MSEESQQALEEATGYYRATGDAAALQEAARAIWRHPRMLQETADGEYRALQEAAGRRGAVRCGG